MIWVDSSGLKEELNEMRKGRAWVRLQGRGGGERGVGSVSGE